MEIIFFTIPLWIVIALILIPIGGAHSFLIWFAKNAFAVQLGGAIIIALIAILLGDSIKQKLMWFSIGILFIEPSLIIAGDFALYYNTTSDFILWAMFNIIVGYILSLLLCFVIEVIIVGLTTYIVSKFISIEKGALIFSVITLLGSILTVYIYHLTPLSPI